MGTGMSIFVVMPRRAFGLFLRLAVRGVGAAFVRGVVMPRRAFGLFLHTMTAAIAAGRRPFVVMPRRAFGLFLRSQLESFPRPQETGLAS